MYNFKKKNGNIQLLGAIHLPAFLDGKKQNLLELEEWLLRNVEAHVLGEFDSVMIQDNTPAWQGHETKSIVYLSALCYAVKKRFKEFPIGLIIESNNAPVAMTIAASTGVQYIRSKVFIGAMQKPAGIVEGSAKQAYHISPLLDCPVSICADIYDRMGQSLFEKDYRLSIAQAVKYGADAVILTGESVEESCTLLSEMRTYYSDIPLLVGGGVNINNINMVAKLCDGVIVSTCLLRDKTKNEWDLQKIKNLVSKVRP